MSSIAFDSFSASRVPSISKKVSTAPVRQHAVAHQLRRGTISSVAAPVTKAVTAVWRDCIRLAESIHKSHCRQSSIAHSQDHCHSRHSCRQSFCRAGCSPKSYRARSSTAKAGSMPALLLALKTLSMAIARRHAFFSGVEKAEYISSTEKSLWTPHSRGSRPSYCSLPRRTKSRAVTAQDSAGRDI